MNPPAPLPLPYEFTVTGRPVSHQSDNKPLLAEWRTRVTTAAARDWTALPLSCALRIVVSYFHEGSTARIDGDNMLKPIQDALIGLLFTDDALITDAQIRKSPIDEPIRARYASRVLLEAFAVGEPFGHVIIDAAPSHAEPLG
jgi:Holliday junction resolvase RusA-like endonuclease